MEYRRLGRSGLQVSVLSFGSWVSLRPATRRRYRGRVSRRGTRRRRELLRQRGVVRGRRVRAHHGRSDRQARLGAAQLRHLDEGVLGTARRPQHEEHAEPQVPDAGDRRFARTARPRLRRPLVLSPRRPEHADRGDGVGDVRHRRRQRQGALLGHLGVGAGRDPRRVGDRRTPSPAQAGDGAAAVQPAATACASSSSTRGCTRTSVSGSRSGVRSRRACSRASTSTAFPDGSRARCPATSGSRASLTEPKTNDRVRALKAVADELGCTPAQLALAWCTKNPHVSTVITGASRAAQVRENMAALDVAARLDADVMARIEDAVPFRQLARGTGPDGRILPEERAVPAALGQAASCATLRAWSARIHAWLPPTSVSPGGAAPRPSVRTSVCLSLRRKAHFTRCEVRGKSDHRCPTRRGHSRHEGRSRFGGRLDGAALRYGEGEAEAARDGRAADVGLVAEDEHALDAADPATGLGERGAWRGSRGRVRPRRRAASTRSRSCPGHAASSARTSPSLGSRRPRRGRTAIPRCRAAELGELGEPVALEARVGRLRVGRPRHPRPQVLEALADGACNRVGVVDRELTQEACRRRGRCVRRSAAPHVRLRAGRSRTPARPGRPDLVGVVPAGAAFVLRERVIGVALPRRDRRFVGPVADGDADRPRGRCRRRGNPAGPRRAPTSGAAVSS